MRKLSDFFLTISQLRSALGRRAPFPSVCGSTMRILAKSQSIRVGISQYLVFRKLSSSSSLSSPVCVNVSLCLSQKILIRTGNPVECRWDLGSLNILLLTFDSRAPPPFPEWDDPIHVRTATWLILPVVICLSQRLSHACLSTSLTKVKPRMAH